MKITLNKKNKLTGIITVEINKGDYEQNVNDVLKRYSKTAKIVIKYYKKDMCA